MCQHKAVKMSWGFTGPGSYLPLLSRRDKDASVAGRTIRVNAWVGKHVYHPMEWSHKLNYGLRVGDGEWGERIISCTKTVQIEIYPDTSIICVA